MQIARFGASSDLLYGGQLSVQDHGLSGLLEGQYVEARDALAKPRAAAFVG